MAGTAPMPREVSPAWLTEVLRAQGQLRAGSVAAVALAETIETPPSLLQQGYRHWWDARDLAYMITPWWYPERRQWLEQPLLRRYYERLLQAGIVGYSWDACWADYRLAAIDNLLSPVLNQHYPRIMWPQLENTVNAFHDLGCDELLA